MKHCFLLIGFSAITLSACGTSETTEKSSISALFKSETEAPNAPARPVCDAIGTKSEGWYLNGELLGWSQCKHKTIACLRVGTRGEGWYEIDGDNNSLVKWALCGSPQL
jgi:hypothetical protein